MKFASHELATVAAVFARSNMGKDLPKVDDVRRTIKNVHTDLEEAVMTFCGDYMESDEHYQFFMDEAKMWKRHKDLKTMERIEAIWPHMAKLFKEALA